MVNSVNARILYLSLLLFIGSIIIELQPYTYITYIYVLPLFEMIGKFWRKSEYILP